MSSSSAASRKRQRTWKPQPKQVSFRKINRSTVGSRIHLLEIDGLLTRGKGVDPKDGKEKVEIRCTNTKDCTEKWYFDKTVSSARPVKHLETAHPDKELPDIARPVTRPLDPEEAARLQRFFVEHVKQNPGPWVAMGVNMTTLETNIAALD